MFSVYMISVLFVAFHYQTSSSVWCKNIRSIVRSLLNAFTGCYFCIASNSWLSVDYARMPVAFFCHFVVLRIDQFDQSVTFFSNMWE